jgi:hypothetical protein
MDGYWVRFLTHEVIPYPAYSGDSFMLQLRLTSLKALATLGLAFALIDVTPAFAQTSDAIGAAPPAASTTKQIRKVPRKAARAKKNAELKSLEKNGYQPGGDLTSYPQNLQNAEHKAAAKPDNNVPASGQ